MDNHGSVIRLEDIDFQIGGGGQEGPEIVETGTARIKEIQSLAPRMKSVQGMVKNYPWFFLFGGGPVVVGRMMPVSTIDEQQKTALLNRAFKYVSNNIGREKYIAHGDRELRGRKCSKRILCDLGTHPNFKGITTRAELLAPVFAAIVLPVRLT